MRGAVPLFSLYAFMTWTETDLTFSRHHHHCRHVAVKELGHLFTRSGLIHPEVPLMVFLASFCLLGRNILPVCVICFLSCCLHVVSSFCCNLLFCLQLGLCWLLTNISIRLVICPWIVHAVHLVCFTSAAVILSAPIAAV